jgi:hypothetical protein
MWGSTRARLQNHVTGVSEGHVAILRLVGVGYRASIEDGGKIVNLKVQYAHPVELPVPQGVKASTPQPTRILLEGPDKEVVKQFAADIRKWREPEPYKGKVRTIRGFWRFRRFGGRIRGEIWLTRGTGYLRQRRDNQAQAAQDQINLCAFLWGATYGGGCSCIISIELGWAKKVIGFVQNLQSGVIWRLTAMSRVFWSEMIIMNRISNHPLNP